MKKPELEQKIEELQAKVNEQTHLASAVEAKDQQISVLQNQVKELKNAAAITHKEFENQLKEQQKKLELFEKYEGVVKKLQDENKKLAAFVNSYANTFKATLKAIQGTLDNSIELEAVLIEKLKGE